MHIIRITLIKIKTDTEGEKISSSSNVLSFYIGLVLLLFIFFNGRNVYIIRFNFGVTSNYGHRIKL